MTILNIYMSNKWVPQYIRHILTDVRGKIDSNTIILGDFNTPVTSMDRTSGEKIVKEI